MLFKIFFFKEILTSGKAGTLYGELDKFFQFTRVFHQQRLFKGVVGG